MAIAQADRTTEVGPDEIAFDSAIVRGMDFNPASVETIDYQSPHDAVPSVYR